MGALKNRDFIYKGLQFHLNDSKYHNEFTPKYLLMFWNDSFGYWQKGSSCIHQRVRKVALPDVCLIVHKTKRHADACLFFNRNPVPISYPRSSRSFSISADESVTPFPIFVRSWFQLRMSYFGSPPFQDTMLTSFFQPLLDSESTPILLRYSAGILGNSITDESRTVF